MLPEEFPLVLTVFMVMGAWRLSRARVLTRRAAAIETLGAATVLCTDKTGTLTENRMTVAERARRRRVALAETGAAPRYAGTPGRLGDAGQRAHPSDPMDGRSTIGARRPGGLTALSRQDLVRRYGLRPTCSP